MRKAALIAGLLLMTSVVALGVDNPPTTFPPGSYSSVGNKTLVASVEATVQVAPPAITLNIYNPTTYNIYRKALGVTNWGSVVHTTSPSDTSWTDTNVTAGTIYEYRVSYNVENLSEITNVVPTGYLTTGIRVDRSATYHGQVILCIDQTFTNTLAYEINRLKKDLSGDGWHTETLFVEPSSTSDWDDGQRAQLIRSNLYSIYTNAPADDKPVAVYLLGHVPPPKSGYNEVSPDGHDAGGAKPADTYYGDIDGAWTDVETWSAGGDENYPGDYTWDQDIIPSDVELAVGRVDMADLSDMNVSEETLLRRYLDKAHAFRQAWVQPGMKVLHQDGNQITDEFAWRELIPICGLSNYQYTTLNNMTGDDAANETDYANKYGPYLFFEQASGGAPLAPEFAQYGSQVVFWNGWQSGYWKWGKRNNMMRAGLASEGLTLGYWSAGRCGWFMQHVAMGLPTSYSLKQTMNNSRLGGPYYFQKSYLIQYQGWRDSSRRVWMNYMGDPTIRWFVTSPPSSLTSQINGADVELSWDASSAENLEGYRVFRADTPLDPFTNQLTTSIITNTTYTDVSAPAGDKVYMVKAVALQRTGSGTFLNPSQGITVPVYTNAPWVALSPEEGMLSMLFQKAAFAAEQTLSITNLGGGTLSGLTVFSPADWFDATLDTNAMTVTIQPNTQADSFAVGTYRGSIAVRADGAETSYLRVTLDVDEEVVPVLSTNSVSIPEGSTNTFQVHLSVNPGVTETVVVSRVSGDSNITLVGSGELVFTTNNWSVDRTVVLQAAEDNGDWLNGSAVIHCVLTGGATGTLIAVESDNDVDPSTVLPFSETFETNSPMAGTLGPVSNQHGWVGGAGAIVTSSDAQSGSQSLALAEDSVSHSFVGEKTNIWITLWSKPVRNAATGGTIPSDASAVFYVNTNDQLVAYSNITPTVITSPTVSNGWNKFAIQCDYISKVWKLELNDELVVSNFAFYAAPAGFISIELESVSTNLAWFDEINITDTPDDIDGDGLPNWWENIYYGSDTAADPNAMASNGVNSVYQAYIAGFNPTNPAAGFAVTDHTHGTQHVIQWNSASGRVYSIYWASNLVTGFGVTPLTNNLSWTPGIFTDTTHSAENEGFYKIEVELE